MPGVEIFAVLFMTMLLIMFGCLTAVAVIGAYKLVKEMLNECR